MFVLVLLFLFFRFFRRCFAGSFGGMAASCFLLAIVGVAVLDQQPPPNNTDAAFGEAFNGSSPSATAVSSAFATTAAGADVIPVSADVQAAQAMAALSVFAFITCFAFGAGPVVRRVDMLCCVDLLANAKRSNTK